MKIAHHRTLIRLAWIIETIAVLFNFMIAVLSLSQYFKASDPVPALLAAAPFVLVAFAEFGKIPFALTMMEARWYWKPVFFGATIAMAGITFLTVSNGLERNFTYQSSEITLTRAHIADLDSKVQALNGHAAELVARRTVLVGELDKLDGLEQAELAAHNERFKLAIANKQNASSKGFVDAIKGNYAGRRQPLVVERDGLDKDIAAAMNGDAKSALRKEIDALKLGLAAAIAENQAYRIAAYVSNKKDVSEVTASEASDVAKYSYGAIALLAAIAGPLLAVGSQVRSSVPVRVRKKKGRAKKAVVKVVSPLTRLVALVRKTVLAKLVAKVQAVKVQVQPTPVAPNLTLLRAANDR